MKRLFFGTILLALISFTVITAAEAAINAGISLSSSIVAVSSQRPIVASDSNGLYVVAEAASDTLQGETAGRDDKTRDESLEKQKPAESKDKSDWKINIWPANPQDKTFPEKKEEDQRHVPPDRF